MIVSEKRSTENKVMKKRGRKPTKANSARMKNIRRQVGDRFSLKEGKDFKLKPQYKNGAISIVDVIALTPSAKEAMPADKTVLTEFSKYLNGSVDAPEATKMGLRIRYVAKANRGPKPKGAPKTKRTARKVGHRKVAGNGKGRKRLPELRLPRNMGHKSHVKAVFGFLNAPLFTDTMRAECVEVIAKFATNTPSCKKYENLLAKLNGKIVLDPKTNKQISESIFKKLKEHSIKLVEPHRKPRKRRATRA